MPYKKVTNKINQYVDPVSNEPVKYRFNPDTGVESKIVEYEEEEYTFPHLENEQLEDFFFMLEYESSGENKTTAMLNFRSEFSFTDDDLFNKPIDESPNEIINRFKEKYKKELDLLKEEVEYFDIYYGVVNYAH